jgi:nicotinamidase/pyrazinamidase
MNDQSVHKERLFIRTRCCIRILKPNPTTNLGGQILSLFIMTTLLIIDCQKDFHPGGSLAIPTADVDARRISSLIRSRGNTISRIIATLESRHVLHIAHPSFWTNSITGERPSPFTIISSADIENGTWMPRLDIKAGGSGRYPFPAFEDQDDTRDVMEEGEGKDETVTDVVGFDARRYCIEYARRLENSGKFQLCIWPEHCLIGSSGHGIVDDVLNAMNEWSKNTGGIVEYVHKGQNPWTEMYSVLCAEVPVGGDTGFNRNLLDSVSLRDDALMLT